MHAWGRAVALATLVSWTVLGAVDVGGDGPVWTPPDAFERRAIAWPAERPAAGTVVFYAILASELFGSNRDLDRTPLFVDYVKHAEIVQAYAVNIGQSPWSGDLGLAIAETGATARRTITDLEAGETTTVSIVGFLDVEGDQVTVTATATQGGQALDAYTRVGTFRERPPLAFAPGAFLRDAGAPASLPPWMDVLPVAFSVFNTSPSGYTHAEVCDAALACEAVDGSFWSGTWRWLNAGRELAGGGCVRTHVDQHPASAGHAANGGGWDDELCLAP